MLPLPREPANRPPGSLWRLPPRADLPGSAWLPNVGYGELSAEFEGYFRDNLARLTGGDRSRPIAVYCQADCWMSWNAAKRALAYGYDQVIWYPEGTDGWRAAGSAAGAGAAGADAGFPAAARHRRERGREDDARRSDSADSDHKNLRLDTYRGRRLRFGFVEPGVMRPRGSQLAADGRANEEAVMQWKTPKIVEIACGCEINAYFPADL